MALNNFKYNHMMILHFKGLTHPFLALRCMRLFRNNNKLADKDGMADRFDFLFYCLTCLF